MMAMKKRQIVSVEKDIEKLEPLYIAGWNVMCSCFGKQYVNSSKCKTLSYHTAQQCHLYVYIQRNKTISPYKNLYTMFIEPLFVIAKSWKTRKCPSTHDRETR